LNLSGGHSLKISVTIRGHRRVIEASISNGKMRLAVDGRSVEADSVATAPGLCSILLEGRSFEAHVKETAPGDVTVMIDEREFLARIGDPRRWQRRREAALGAEGRQHVTASMPGKVVRVLVAAGEAVEAGQGLVVIEAMKMQNEVRSPRSGRVERLLVTEGQAVNGGEILAVVG
jgi:biotin carboxyl carrier protein